MRAVRLASWRRGLDVQKREDRLMDKISELIAERDMALSELTKANVELAVLRAERARV